MDYKVFLIHDTNVLALEKAINSIKEVQDDIIVFNNTGISLPPKLKKRVSEILPLAASNYAQTMNQIFKMSVAGSLDYVFIARDNFVMETKKGMRSFINVVPEVFEDTANLALLMTNETGYENYDEFRKNVVMPNLMMCLPNSIFRSNQYDLYLHDYVADADFFRRIRLQKQTIEIVKGITARRTIQMDDQATEYFKLMYPTIFQLYIKKWGGSPGNETLKVPKSL